MNRFDASDATLALLTGFLVSLGLTGFILSAGGYQLPTIAPAPPVAVAGPAAGVSQPPALAQSQARTAPASQVTSDVKIVATDLKFTPATIQAKVGQPIKVTFENKGVIEHDLTFPTLKADKPAGALKVVARPGQTATLELTPTAKGTYEYVCTIPGHKEAGMKGVITVGD
jgi:plastocyanin